MASSDWDDPILTIIKEQTEFIIDSTHHSFENLSETTIKGPIENIYKIKSHVNPEIQSNIYFIIEETDTFSIRQYSMDWDSFDSKEKKIIRKALEDTNYSYECSFNNSDTTISIDTNSLDLLSELDHRSSYGFVVTNIAPSNSNYLYTVQLNSTNNRDLKKKRFDNILSGKLNLHCPRCGILFTEYSIKQTEQFICTHCYTGIPQKGLLQNRTDASEDSLDTIISEMQSLLYDSITSSKTLPESITLEKLIGSIQLDDRDPHLYHCTSLTIDAISTPSNSPIFAYSLGIKEPIVFYSIGNGILKSDVISYINSEIDLQCTFCDEVVNQTEYRTTHLGYPNISLEYPYQSSIDFFYTKEFICSDCCNDIQNHIEHILSTMDQGTKIHLYSKYA